jgi:hypothetical protein
VRNSRGYKGRLIENDNIAVFVYIVQNENSYEMTTHRSPQRFQFLAVAPHPLKQTSPAHEIMVWSRKGNKNFS